MSNDEIIKMAWEAGFLVYEDSYKPFTAFAALVSARAAKDEREAIASILENTDLTQAGEFRLWIAKLLGHYVDVIRARGDQ